MTRRNSSEAAILVLLQRKGAASAVEIGIACRMTSGEVRGRLVMLESMRLVSGRQNLDATRGKPQRVYVVTEEGRRKAGIGDARSTTLKRDDVVT